MKKAKEIIEILNAVDENVKLEAKRGSSIDKSVMESICAFSNEPNLGGGLIVLGIQREENYSNTKIDRFIYAVIFYSEQISSPLFLSFVPVVFIDSDFEQFKMKKEMSYL